MRSIPKLVHPTIVKATRSVVWSGGAGRDPKAMAAYQSAWFREHGIAFFGYLVSVIALFICSIAFAKTLDIDKPLRLLLPFSTLGLVGAVGIVATVRNSQSPSLSELETLLPILDLSEVGKAYVETLVALHRSGRSRAEIEETGRTLNALLDEEARLLALQEGLTGQETSGLLQRMDSERATLTQKANAASDPVAREAYEQSLTLLDERIAGLHSTGAGLERIEAHLELLRQALLATRDAARRLGSAPRVVPDLGTDSLRAAVALAQAQTSETERALVELRAI